MTPLRENRHYVALRNFLSLAGFVVLCYVGTTAAFALAWAFITGRL